VKKYTFLTQFRGGDDRQTRLAKVASRLIETGAGCQPGPERGRRTGVIDVECRDLHLLDSGRRRKLAMIVMVTESLQQHDAKDQRCFWQEAPRAMELPRPCRCHNLMAKATAACGGSEQGTFPW
jgi:hypothetical protein